MNRSAVTISATGRRMRTWIAVCLPVLALMMASTTPSGAATASGGATLTVSPGTYVGGQLVTFQGNLGETDVRTITLQQNLNRPGDTWNDIDGPSWLTQADGSFSFAYPAPAMFNISYRVVSGSLHTPGWTFDAKSQDVMLDVVSTGLPVVDGKVLAGVPFLINVDTAPMTLARRPDLPPPVITGRTLTLQQRVKGDQWQNLDQTVTDAHGTGQFTQTVDQPGDVVYRVREEDWTQDGDQIGWFPSFPTYVHVVDPLALKVTAADPEPRLTVSSSSATSLPARRNVASTTASQTYGWGRSLWDFAWESGQSLTDPPSRGTDPRGRWLDTSNGAGRAAPHNGGLMLDSQRDNVDGPGDFGTTAATLRGNPIKYGRWEVRLRVQSTETDTRDYHATIELVPARASNYHCGAQNITVADVTAHGSSVTFGAKALNGAKWTRTLSNMSVNGQALAFAVEVTRNHISWFKEGELIGTVRSRAAVSDVPMTLRLSLVGDGQQEMNRTQANSDWMRGFSLDNGQRVADGPALERGTHNDGC